MNTDKDCPECGGKKLVVCTSKDFEWEEQCPHCQGSGNRVVVLSENQELPENPVQVADEQTGLLHQTYSLAQQDMLAQNFRRVEL